MNSAHNTLQSILAMIPRCPGCQTQETESKALICFSVWNSKLLSILWCMAPSLQIYLSCACAPLKLFGALFFPSSLGSPPHALLNAQISDFFAWQKVDMSWAWKPFETIYFSCPLKSPLSIAVLHWQALQSSPKYQGEYQFTSASLKNFYHLFASELLWSFVL